MPGLIVALCEMGSPRLEDTVFISCQEDFSGAVGRVMSRANVNLQIGRWGHQILV